MFKIYLLEFFKKVLNTPFHFIFFMAESFFPKNRLISIGVLTSSFQFKENPLLSRTLAIILPISKDFFLLFLKSSKAIFNMLDSNAYSIF